MLNHGAIQKVGYYGVGWPYDVFFHTRNQQFSRKKLNNIDNNHKNFLSYLNPWLCFRLWCFFYLFALHCNIVFLLYFFMLNMVCTKKQQGEIQMLLHSTPNIDWTSVWAQFQVVNNAGVLSMRTVHTVNFGQFRVLFWM